MLSGFILFFLVAAVDWLAIARGQKKLEYLAKPAAMLVLLGLLAWVGGFSSLPVLCFALGIFFSMAGDICLMLAYAHLSDRWFFGGMAAFFLTHLAYIIGLNIPMPNVSGIWSLGLALVLAVSTARILRRILAGVRKKGLPRLERPVAAYGMLITLMLLSALLTLNNDTWKVFAAVLVAVGAILFYFSDIILAWNKFVDPIKHGRLANMILYHLGQAALVAGVILQFGTK